MACNKCNEDFNKQVDGCNTPGIIEINNEAEPVMFYKTTIPASAGDDTTIPPTNGKYKNMLVVYEANQHTYLYNSVGIPTRLRSETDFDEIPNRPKYAGSPMTSSTNIPDIGTMRADIDTEISDRQNADTALQTSLEGQIQSEANTREDAVTALEAAITTEESTRALADTALQEAIALKPDATDLSAVATTGNYDDLSNTPTNVSDFANDAGYQNGSQVTAAISDATAPITSALNKNVLADLTINSAYSSSVIAFDKAKQNILSGSTSTSLLSMPIATSDTAGIINPSIYNTIQSNSTNIQAILNGSVSIADLPASPTQVQLTTAWQGATGLTTVINGAKINDSSNQKVWTYYANTDTWYAATNTTQVVVNQWTNSAAGIIKGSTGDGQIFAENDGTGSVNGWDALNDTVSTINSNYAKITMTSTDPGEGQPLAANNFIFVYED